jgi:hypothetical protein
MTKQEVINLIYTKKAEGLEFTEEEKQHISNYYTEDQVNCMNTRFISLESCLRKTIETESTVGGL